MIWALFFWGVTAKTYSTETPDIAPSKIRSTIIETIKHPSISSLTPSPLSISGNTAMLTFAEKGRKGTLRISVSLFSSNDLASNYLSSKGILSSGIMTPVKNFIGDETLYFDYSKEPGVSQGGWIMYRKGSAVIYASSILIKFDDLEKIARKLEPHIAMFKFKIEESSGTNSTMKDASSKDSYTSLTSEEFSRLSGTEKMEFLTKELAIINTAVEQCAYEKNIPTGGIVEWADIEGLLKPQSGLRETAADPRGIKYPERFIVGKPLLLKSRFPEEGNPQN